MDHVYQPLDDAMQAYAEDCLGIKCYICNIYAKDQIGVHSQWIEGETSVYTDRADGSKWVNCDKCTKHYHLKCVTSESVEQVSKQRFICTFMGCKQ